MDISYFIGLYLFFATFFYLFVHLGLRIGIKRAPQSRNSSLPFVSVIIAARNEKDTISRLLHCLSNQTYSHLEIIVVNDRSTDGTSQIIEEFQKTHSAVTRLDIVEIPDDMPPKKNALRAGINASKGEILCLTDADCFPPPSWVEELVYFFHDDVGVVAGYSPYHNSPLHDKTCGVLKKIFYQFIAYEEFRAALWSSGSIGWNLGWLCTGRNFSYRRKVYDEVNGFEQIKHSISGDDDLFLQLVRRQTDWKIRYIQSRESFVPTLPPPDFRSFVNQRTRHFSASKIFSIPMMMFFFFYHSANLLILLSPFLYVFHLLPLPILVTAVAGKLFADALLIIPHTQTFDCVIYNRSFLAMEVFYIFYNSLIGPLGIFNKFKWK
jgi:cellulose synthase/poly-beta-1,6-N-acetylglucosamine synthase-like glycosyltransferase